VPVKSTWKAVDRPRGPRPRTALVIAASVLAGAALVLVPTACTRGVVHVPTTAAAGAGVLPWTPCGDGLDCAKITVPLDYSRPTGRTISIAMARKPATDPLRRVGSVFFNPGGPGASGIEEVRTDKVGSFLPGLNERFDLIGFDPRGVGESTAARCFTSAAEQQAFLSSIVSFPITPAEFRVSSAADRRYAQLCAQRNPELLSHLSTANVARDLDRLRAAVGDDKLTYVGSSYGSFLGETYTNLFPDRVRAVLLDGVVDPASYLTNRAGEGATPFLRIRSQVGASDTLSEFVRLCAAGGPRRCSFAGGTQAATQNKLDVLMERLRRGPVTTAGKTPAMFSYQQVVDKLWEALYSPGTWPATADFLQSLSTAPDAGQAALSPPAPEAPNYDQTLDALNVILCDEVEFPKSAARFETLAQDAELAAPYMGAKWTWIGLPCAFWKATDAARYTGPWNRETKVPVLLVGFRHDPAVPYSSAVAATRWLGNTRLLTVDGWGHRLFKGSTSACAQRAEVAYLVDLKVPEDGKVCAPDAIPFGK
jgi:pimeloyl-ACP methyl ester carboxylesterase